MTMKPNGGPAFPVPNDQYPQFNGMTLRDYFAAQVLAGIEADFSSSGPSWFEQLSWFEQYGAAWIYRVADAMIAAREVQP
mgnify:CR=1 FL=1